MALDPNDRVLHAAKYGNSYPVQLRALGTLFYYLLVSGNGMFRLKAIIVFNRCSRILESNVFLSPSALLILLAEVSTAGHATSGVGEPWSHIFKSNNMSFAEIKLREIKRF